MTLWLILRKIYTITDEGNMGEHLDIQPEHTGNSIRMSQPLLIERTIDEIPGMINENPVNYISLPSAMLTKDEQGTERV